MCVTLPYGIFRKNAEHTMCGLTTGWIFRKCPNSSVCTYHNMDFRKNAEHLMCDLTTEWILESAQCFSVCTYIVLFTFYARGTRYSEGSGMLIDDPLQ